MVPLFQALTTSETLMHRVAAACNCSAQRLKKGSPGAAYSR
jgi:hypothetical protein